MTLPLLDQRPRFRPADLPRVPLEVRVRNHERVFQVVPDVVEIGLEGDPCEAGEHLDVVGHERSSWVRLFASHPKQPRIRVLQLAVRRHCGG